MASGWDQAQKKVIRNNGRNQGATIWDEDAVGGQVIDSQGHDTNDQTLADSITETVNLRGWNEMLGDFNVGGFKILALAPGTAGTDGVNWTQLDVVDTKADANAAAIIVNAADIATNVTDIGTNASDIAALQTGATDAVITAQTWLGNNFTSVRVDPDFVTEIRMLTQFVSNGLIRHKLVNEGAGSNNIDVGAANRHHVVNAGALTLTLTNLPAVDADIGDTYQQEGQIIIDNTTAGVITLSPVGVVIGIQSAANSVSQILTYAIQRIGGVNKVYYIWSAA